jgi:hypothetical protein
MPIKASDAHFVRVHGRADCITADLTVKTDHGLRTAQR